MVFDPKKATSVGGGVSGNSNSINSQSVRLTVKKFIYELYDFDQGLYRSVEEGICAILSRFPNEDPMELMGLSLNDEIFANYAASRAFMHQINRIEKER